jgi:hypothetical protein
MNWKELSNRLLRRNPARLRFQLPAFVVEAEPEFVAGAHLDRSSRKIKRIGVRELVPGNLRPTAIQSNFERPAELEQAFGEMAGDLGGAGGALGLLLPDAVVRVTLLSFETLPDSNVESDALIRWRLKSLLPYGVEESRVSYEVFRNGTGPVEVLVMVARASVVAEYEAALSRLNGQLALILPATAALLPLLPSTGGGSLLIHASGAGLTTVVVAGQRVLLWRHETADSQDAIRASAAAEAARALASASDRLKIEIQRIWVCARPSAPDDLAHSVAHATSQEVATLSCPAGFTSALSPEGRILFDRFGMPFAGLVANGG